MPAFSSLSITADHCDSQRLLAGPRVFTSQNWQTPASECSVTEMKTETPILLWAKKKKLQKCAWRLKMQCPNQNAVWGLWAYLLSEVADEAKYHTYTYTYNKQGHLYFIHNWTLIKSQLFIGIYQANTQNQQVRCIGTAVFSFRKAGSGTVFSLTMDFNDAEFALSTLNVPCTQRHPCSRYGGTLRQQKLKAALIKMTGQKELCTGNTVFQLLNLEIEDELHTWCAHGNHMGFISMSASVLWGANDHGLSLWFHGSLTVFELSVQSSFSHENTGKANSRVRISAKAQQSTFWTHAYQQSEYTWFSFHRDQCIIPTEINKHVENATSANGKEKERKIVQGSFSLSGSTPKSWW